MMIEEKLLHLPQSKQRMVKLMLDTILRTFQEQFGPRSGPSVKMEHIPIAKIILFGSHARGGYVNDNASGYHSDYDFCIIVTHARYTNFKYWRNVEQALRNIPALSASDHSKASLVIHSYNEMNEKLKDGWPFYLDIVNDGITLYELEGYELSTIGPMKPKRRKEMAEKWFQEYIEQADDFIKLVDMSRGSIANKRMAFLLHQITESLYLTILLTFTLYAPKLHDLKNLHHRAVELVPELKDLWPINNHKERRAFERLRDAYVKARYSPEYEITNDELDWLEARIKVLRQCVETACKNYLAKP